VGDNRQVRVEDSQKRVRVVFAGTVVADTTAPKLVWEKPYYPTYYFPEDAVRSDVLVATGEQHRAPNLGKADVLTVKAGGREAVAAARHYHSSPVEELAGTIRLAWDAMDAWFEEDEEVYVHPRDPYKRVDVLHSSRHVRVVVDGVTVADSHRPRLLFETGLPTRYYLPKTHVRMDLLEPTDSESHCPYKGQAEYWSLGAEFPDIAWCYRTPLPESEKIAGLVAFYNERADIVVDGVLQERPITKFS
jgi:uncharacterized protein (DUF427 family)